MEGNVSIKAVFLLEFRDNTISKISIIVIFKNMNDKSIDESEIQGVYLIV